MEADQDRDGKISFEEFTKMVENTDVSMSMTLGKLLSYSVPYYRTFSRCRSIPASIGDITPASGAYPSAS